MSNRRTNRNGSSRQAARSKLIKTSSSNSRNKSNNNNNSNKSKRSKTTRRKTSLPRNNANIRRNKNSNSFANVPVAQAFTTTTTQAKFSGAYDQRYGSGVTIRHREPFLSINENDVSGNNTYSGTKVSINPGLANSFPWLSLIARAFEKWRPNKLKLIWIPKSPTSKEGEVSLSFNYDALAPLPLTEQKQMQLLGSKQTNLFNYLDITADHFDDGHLYVRSGQPPASADLKMYDPGFFIFNIDTDSAELYTYGSLWIEYDITLYCPTGSGQPPSVCVANGGAPSPSNPFGTISEATLVGPSPLVLTGGGAFEFETPGTFMITTKCDGTLEAVPSAPVLASATGATITPNAPAGVNAGYTSTANQNQQFSWVVEAEAGDEFSIDMAPSFTAVTDFIFEAMPIAAEMLTMLL